MYIGDGDYKAAEEYSKGKNIGAMLRVFPNGQLMINDFAKHEIIETTANEFLGYYDESMMFDEHDHCAVAVTMTTSMNITRPLRLRSRS